MTYLHPLLIWRGLFQPRHFDLNHTQARQVWVYMTKHVRMRGNVYRHTGPMNSSKNRRGDRTRVACEVFSVTECHGSFGLFGLSGHSQVWTHTHTHTHTRLLLPFHFLYFPFPSQCAYKIEKNLERNREVSFFFFFFLKKERKRRTKFERFEWWRIFDHILNIPPSFSFFDGLSLPWSC